MADRVGDVQSAYRAEMRKEEVWNNIENRISKSKSNVPHISLRQKLLRVAAVLIPTIVVATALLTFGPSSSESTYATTHQTDTINLPDGSIAILAVGSSINYSQNWRGRYATLSGTALFKVKKDSQHPFYVNASDVDIKVLGTTFRVENRAEQAHVRTCVEEGKVSVRVGKQKVILTRGQEATWTGKTLVAKNTNLNGGLSVGVGCMNFKDVSLRLVVEEVAMKYHKQVSDIKFLTEPDSIRITTMFDNEPIDDVLHEIAVHSGKKIELNKGCLTISD